MSRLTPTQRGALVALADGGTYSPSMLATRTDTSKEGAAQTASSLVRRHLVERIAGPHVTYRITPVGLEWVDHQQLAAW